MTQTTNARKGRRKAEVAPTFSQDTPGKAPRAKPGAPLARTPLKLKGVTALAKPPGGKLGVVVDLMRRPEGATVPQMMAATGWQAHSVRGALAGSLKRKHGLTITGEAGEDGKIYRIAVEPTAE